MYGPYPDCNAFTEWLSKNMTLSALSDGRDMSTSACANFARNELSKALRKKAKQANLIIGGYDESEGASCYFLDYLGTLKKANFCAHGMATAFTIGLFDREWKADLSVDEAIELAKHCMQELSTRLAFTMQFRGKIVSKDGVREVDLGVVGGSSE
jgi:20S proteasome subunit beta 4